MECHSGLDRSTINSFGRTVKSSSENEIIQVAILKRSARLQPARGTDGAGDNSACLAAGPPSTINGRLVASAVCAVRERSRRPSKVPVGKTKTLVIALPERWDSGIATIRRQAGEV